MRGHETVVDSSRKLFPVTPHIYAQCLCVRSIVFDGRVSGASILDRNSWAKERKNAYRKPLALSGWGLGVGPTTPPCKNYLVTETATMNSNPQSPMGISSQATELGSTTAPSENPSRNRF